MIIYKVTNIINNKIYIGQTIHSLNIRKSQHERSHEYGYKTAFSNAIKKYGKENFIWEIIYETDCIFCVGISSMSRTLCMWKRAKHHQ